MDEPFAALDAMTREMMQGELLRLMDELDQTVLFVIHSIDQALTLIATAQRSASCWPTWG